MVSRVSAVWIGVFLLQLTACTRELRLSRNHFRLAQTPHFSVYTDVSERRAIQFARTLEALLYGVERKGWSTRGSLPVHLNVLAFARPDDFERYATTGVSGYHVSNVLFEPWVILPAPRSQGGLEVVVHELAHYIVSQAMPNHPPWLGEGLTTYFQSARFEGSDTFVLGSIPASIHDPRIAPRKPSELLSAETADLSGSYYASAWLLTHYLRSRKAEAFSTFQLLLAKGESYEQAYADAFGSFDAPQLDAAVERYLQYNRFDTFRFRLAQPAVDVSVHTLSPADEHVLHGMLRAVCLGCSGRKADWLPSIEAALASEPHHLRARAFLLVPDELRSRKHSARRKDEAQASYRKRLADARTLCAEHPDHYLSWMTLVGIAIEQRIPLAPEGGVDPVERLLSLAPKRGIAWAMAAFQFALRGDVAGARAAVERAQRVAPAGPLVLLLRVRVMAMLNDCEGLREAIRLYHSLPHTTLSASTFHSLAETCFTQEDRSGPPSPSMPVSMILPQTGADIRVRAIHRPRRTGS